MNSNITYCSDVWSKTTFSIDLTANKFIRDPFRNIGFEPCTIDFTPTPPIWFYTRNHSLNTPNASIAELIIMQIIQSSRAHSLL